MDQSVRYAAFESWGTWTVQRFEGDKGGEIVATIKGVPHPYNEKVARQMAEFLNNGND